MIILFSLFFFLLGCIVGSFLNVIILRYNTGRGINGRSGCFSCGATLGWYELVPVISFICQGARCRTCKAKLSWQYPLVEFFTGLVFLTVFLKYLPVLMTSLGVGAAPSALAITLSSLIFYLIIFSVLIVIFVYDLRHKIIPDGLVYTFAGLALLKVLIAHVSLWNLAAGPILFLPFFLLWFLSKGRWMGFGDAKLALGIGWLLGTGLGFSAIVIGFWTGAIIGILLLSIGRLNIGSIKLTIKSEIPFAPFLIAGLVLVYFTRLDVVGIHRLFGI